MAHRIPGAGMHAWRRAPWLVAVLILLMPLAAMQFTEALAWDGADFALLGAMLFAACGACELAARTSGGTAYRAATTIAVAAALLLVWLNLAVGLIGSEDDPANLMHGGVLLLGIVLACIGRLRPRGMARALVATALAQVLVGAIAVLAGLGAEGANWPWTVVLLTAAFAALWLASAWLFRRAAREHGAADAAR